MKIDDTRRLVPPSALSSACRFQMGSAGSELQTELQQSNRSCSSWTQTAFQIWAQQAERHSWPSLHLVDIIFMFREKTFGHPWPLTRGRLRDENRGRTSRTSLSTRNIKYQSAAGLLHTGCTVWSHTHTHTHTHTHKHTYCSITQRECHLKEQFTKK